MTEHPLPKFCVFCGQKPKTKTKEHIIPLWLIKLTGDPNRKVRLGIDSKLFRTEKRFEFRERSFSSFQFPACESCNNEFSDFEVEAKTIIEKVLKKEYLTNIEISRLLDWFDKIRIGLWLGFLLLDREIPSVNPNFFIKNRIGEKDRCLFVYEINDNLQGLQFLGTDFPIFKYTPSCFALCINNYYFYNISFDFLFSRNIGFPFPTKQRFESEGRRTFFDLNKGLSKKIVPLINMSFLKPIVQLYQPMIYSKLAPVDQVINTIYDCEYIRSHCIDFKKGIGKVFFMEKNKILELDDESELCISDGGPKYERGRLMNLTDKQILATQLRLFSKLPSYDNLNPEERKKIRNDFISTIAIQKRLLKAINESSSKIEK
jgi:hypothetical protein